MAKLFITSVLSLFLGFAASAASIPYTFIFDNAEQEAYINRYKEVAIREMERSGVPASIKLAQGILESDSGQSVLARSANNHFGIKCGSNWKGEEYYRKDDDYDSNGQLIKSCFRQYRNAEASFVAHSEFLRDPAKSFRYGFLFRLDPRDYKGWANGLRQAGYATNPRYPELLIGIIERYNLQQYDAPGAVDPVEVENPTNELITGILQTNDVSYFVSEAPISVEAIAKQVDLSVQRLLDYNEGLSQSSQLVAPTDRVYLQKKRKSYRGREQFHTVEVGEDLYAIAQRYGLRLEHLARRNRLNEAANPATGQKVKLRGGKVDNPPRLEGEIDPNTPVNDIPTNDKGEIDLLDPTDEPTTPRPGVVILPRPNPTPPPPTTPVPTTPPPTTVVVPGSPSVPPTTVIPVPNVPPTTVPPGNPSLPQPVFHSVQAGETLYAISRTYGVTVESLRQLNSLSTNTISIGQQLRVR
ncbi:LysM peptidoglycan-binding domain-containing protein [Neolewinella lacunae]|uniref:Peptidoglycan hydrolase n=1 Tax=Neolewinella lacunae TaxID=1517758 RepID=A0A923PKH6_9BACT|nr:glucosaminidase domain-containing protein [Neolewinella lacunae]MBC6994220.1 LysM peptidoglycan-binding domain-containing protein [Neolewinella lacunae]MDN3634621.1 LysM peptidoglycan-binding domain-containing protein [Neolewinella lacunae]